MKILGPYGLVDNLHKYVQTNIEIAKVEVQEKVEDAIKKVCLIAVLVVIGTLFLIFLFVTLALFLNKVLASQYLGFLCVTILLGVTCGIVYLKIKPKLEPSKSVEKLKEFRS